jgi:hypothetical protein
MGETELKQEMEELGALIGTLEAKAGIEEAVKHARETGAPEKLKDAYFSVADTAIRQELIHTTGRLDQLYLEKCDLDVVTAKDEVSKAIEKSQKQPWHLSITSSVGALIIGQWLLGFPGAIGGAVAGYFLGQWLLSSLKKENMMEIERAKHRLISAEKRNEASRVAPYLFSTEEQEASGRVG